jgi:hypothetical protein
MTRHAVKPRCKYHCKFLQIADELWLCPHASYGAASYMLGAVEEGRRLLERAGGYDAVLARLEAAEYERKQARLKTRIEDERKAEAAVRYDR